MARSMIQTIARHVEGNPSFAPRVKRWALGSGYRYAFQVLLRDRRMLPAIAAYTKLLLNDPALSVITTTEVLIAISKRLRRDRPIGSPLPFLSVDPEAGKNDSVDVVARMKQRRLADEDRALEQKGFSPGWAELPEMIGPIARPEKPTEVPATGAQHCHTRRAR